MERLERKYKNLVNAQEALEKSIRVHMRDEQTADKDPDLHETITSGVINKFTMAYEMAWKYLKAYLEVKHQVNEKSPRAIFQACYECNILRVEVLKELVRITDKRNEVVHVYDQDVAEEVCALAAEFHKTLAEVVKIMPNK